MKMYDGVLQRVKQVEEKHGIKYATTDGMLYKTLSILLIIALIYTIGINLLCVAGAALKISSLYSGTVATIDGKSYNEVEYWEYQGLDAKKMEDNIVSGNRDLMINAGVCAILLILGFVLNRVRFYIAGGVITVLPAIYSIFYFMHNLTDSGGVVGLSPKFYWRHLIPLTIIIIAIIWLTIIAVRAKTKLQNQYKKVSENLFNMYNVELGKNEFLSDEQWDEFLKTYDPKTDYRKQFAANEKTDEEA